MWGRGSKKEALLFQSTIGIRIQKPAALCSVATKLRRLALCAFIYNFEELEVYNLLYQDWRFICRHARFYSREMFSSTRACCRGIESYLHFCSSNAPAHTDKNRRSKYTLVFVILSRTEPKPLLFIFRNSINATMLDLWSRSTCWYRRGIYYMRLVYMYIDGTRKCLFWWSRPSTMRDPMVRTNHGWSGSTPEHNIVLLLSPTTSTYKCFPICYTRAYNYKMAACRHMCGFPSLDHADIQARKKPRWKRFLDNFCLHVSARRHLQRISWISYDISRWWLHSGGLQVAYAPLRIDNYT